MSETSKNCCPSTLPPVTTTNYALKGTYEDISGLKAYITGSAASARGIIHIYDIFGFFPNTLQGSDRLAASLDAIVLVPDFFEGSPAKPEWHDPNVPKDEETMAAQASFQSRMDPSKHVETLLKTMQEMKGKYPEIQSWGVFGLCWGGKVAALASGPNTPFKVSGQAHPAYPTKEDVEAMNIPHICLAAPTDNKDGGIDAYKEVLGQKGKVGEVETYSTMFHGWMGARANLEDKENAGEYERGYNQVATFFAKHF